VLLSIDQSTAATKAMLWTVSDKQGALIARADAPHKQITNEKGWVEHDGAEILQNTYKAVKAVLEKSQINPAEIQAVGISNQRETAICWDRKTGEPLYNAIVWQCGRAVDITNELGNLSDYIRKTTGLTLSPFFSGAKFAWMERHVPEVGAARRSGSLCCGTIDSWLIFKLTGNFKTDYSNASRTQLLDLKNLRWDETIAGAFSLKLDCLPEICMSDSHFGMTDFGGILPAAVPVHGVLGDSHGALFGNECFEPFTAKATYGTGSSVMMNAGTALPAPVEGVVASAAWGMDGKVTYVLEGNINYTGAVTKWLVEDIGLLPDSKSAGKVAASVPDSGGVYLVPAFTGLGAPYFNNEARAAFLGMNSATKRAHLVRAAEECIAYQIRDVVEAINRSSAQPLTILRADGGPTRDEFLMKFQSGILGIPVEVSQTEELSGMGAAFCAAVGMGLCTREALTQARRRIEPEMDNATREKLYSGWKNAVKTVERGSKK